MGIPYTSSDRGATGKLRSAGLSIAVIDEASLYVEKCSRHLHESLADAERLGAQGKPPDVLIVEAPWYLSLIILLRKCSSFTLPPFAVPRPIENPLRTGFSPAHRQCELTTI
jgi:hypothetical protein